tara:strand:- start:968 stop:4591 length:3624 start_codon:yes stop_codon:yes gene_type:complete
MASDSNKVFVSPGVYTSEKDLSFVAQSVGVTTLGLAGETLQGPAFEPILISSYGEFQTYFGTTSTEKYVETQIPKYELSYIAKAYLQQSNQLFVTRVLGYSGFDAGPSWSILTRGNVNCATIQSQCTSWNNAYVPGFASGEGTFPGTGYYQTGNTQYDIQSPTGFYYQGSGQTSCYGASGKTPVSYLVTNVPTYWSGTSVTSGPLTTFANGSMQPLGDDWYSANLPAMLVPTIDEIITKYDGSTTTLRQDLNSFFYALYNNFSHPSVTCATGATPCYTNLSGTSLAYQYGVSNFDVGNPNSGSTWPAPVINQSGGFVDDTFWAAFSGVSSNRLNSQYNPNGYADAPFCDAGSNTNQNDSWEYTFFDYVDGAYTGISFTIGVDVAAGAVQDASTSDKTNLYTGNTSMTFTYWSAATYCDFDNQVVATFRSRGVSTLSSGGPEYRVTGATDVSFVCTGSTYDDVLVNPFSTFAIDVTDKENRGFRFDTNMATTDKKYLKKVFGVQPFDKDMLEVPIFVEEAYPNMLTHAYKKGFVRGLQCTLLNLPEFRNPNNTNTIGFYQEQWQTPVTPYVVSELRGSKVYKLFRVVSVADGNAANTAIKISVVNISLERSEFDLIVRDYYDTDSSPTVLEKYTRCSMNPQLNTYVGNKVGTVNGDYELKSRYIMLDMDPELEMDNNLWDAVPCGFEGYISRSYDAMRSPTLYYKTKYDAPGDVIYDPPFGTTAGLTNRSLSSGDKIRTTYLGISDVAPGAYDDDFFQYKGKQAPTNACNDSTGDNWACLTQGFHLDSGATCSQHSELCAHILCGCPYGSTSSSATTDQFAVGDAPFTKEPTNIGSPYYKLQSRKFTFMPYGGFDGWDIYRKFRTNGDGYIRGKSGFLNGACSTTQFPGATGDGSFKFLTKTPWGEAGYFATTDYYAYLFGIRTFRNPEAVNINVFSTPGIDYVNNSNLVEESIEMVVGERADSLYVCTTPDFNMFVSSPSDPSNIIQPTEAVDNLDNTGIDSNYTATYYPWVLHNDTENNTRIWLPPTYDVMRNVALTDNISFPWFASAGYTRGIVNAVKARKKLTLDERDTLYAGRINPIATFSDVGTIIWGNKTLQSRESALDRINVRRLLLQARKLISSVSVKLVFEQNDEQVRNEFLDLVNPILDSIRRERGLTDFRVVVSDDPQLIDQNTLEGKIYIKPTRSLEFISVEFLITPTGASFENI